MTSANQILEAAWQKRGEGDETSVLALLKEAESLVSGADYLLLGRIYHIYAQLKSDRNDHESAVPLIRKSLGFYVESGDKLKVAHSTRHLADVLRRLGLYSESESNYREALRIYGELENTRTLDVANLLRGLGLVQEEMGNLDGALDTWKEAGDAYDSLGVVAGVNESRERIESITRELAKR